jgi:hypothetical protein
MRIAPGRGRNAAIRHLRARTGPAVAVLVSYSGGSQSSRRPPLCHRIGRERGGALYDLHFTGVTASGVPLVELIQPDVVSLHGLGRL